MPQLRIQLFGEFQVRLGESPIARLNAPRTQALLAYLVLHRGAPQPRYYVAFQLWPDAHETQARANLRYQLHLLRKALPDAEHVLHVDELVLQWRAMNPAAIDVAEFESAIAEANDAEQAGQWMQWRAALERATRFYQGDLLPSCYDDWILPERERLRQLFTQALERLVNWLAEQREHRAAIAAAQQLLRHDPVHEATYRQLIRLRQAVGDRIGALRVYHACVAVLQRELGVEPSGETRDLYEQLLNQTATHASVPASANSILNILDGPPHNLPIQLSSFVGREGELAEIRERLAHTRLLTLTGPGGAGKTRLALEAATESLLARTYEDGVWRVALDALTDPDLIAQALAAALGVREQRRQPLTHRLLEHLRSKELLLLFDNCEHLLTACGRLIELLLSACPRVRVLATSREPLRIEEEVAWLVPSLSLPDPRECAREQPELDVLLQSGAVQLFVERATAILPRFSLTTRNARAVVEICARLDGIPLAIELAAARVNVLSVEQIAARLGDALALLSAGNRSALLPRHRTLQATHDWSHRLLSEPERVLFRRLAVFAGGFTLEAVERVCDENGIRATQVLDALAQLVDKSLVMAETQQQSEARYCLLETMRQYAHEKLVGCDELPLVRRKHAQYFLALAEAGDAGLAGPMQARWLHRLEREHDNFRGALDWALRDGDLALGLRLGGELARFWWIRGYASEGRERLRQLLERSLSLTPSDASHMQAHERAVLGAFLLAWRSGELDRARDFAEESLALQRDQGNQIGIAYALLMLSNVASALGADAQAQKLLEESLAIGRAINDKRTIGNALNNLGEIARTHGDYVRAAACYTEALAIYQELGTVEASALTYHNLGQVALAVGDWAEAALRFNASLAIYGELEHKTGIAMCLAGIAGLAAARGDSRRTARLAGSVEFLLNEIGGQLDSTDGASFARAVACARAQLADEVFAQEQAEGRALMAAQNSGQALDLIAAFVVTEAEP